MVGSCRGGGMMMMMVLHVLHFTGISRRARRRGVIATASEGHVQITARRRHVRGRGPLAIRNPGVELSCSCVHSCIPQ